MLTKPNAVACYLEKKDELVGRETGATAGTAPAAAPNAPPPVPPAPPPVAGGRAGPPIPPPALPIADDIYQSISASYHLMRIGMALLTIAFPILLWLWTDPLSWESSLSAYYHYSEPGGIAYGAGDARNIFVGVLWAIGIFLILYRGYSPAENLALNGAGICAILVSLLPMDWPVTANPATSEAARSTIGTLHFVSAVTFFLLIAGVCLFLARDTLPLLKDPDLERRFSRYYNLWGALMIAAPAAAFLAHLALDVPGRERFKLIWWIEVAGIYVFASFWITKTLEIRRIERRLGLNAK